MLRGLSLGLGWGREMGVGSWELGDWGTGRLGDWETQGFLYPLPFTLYPIPDSLKEILPQT